jgi:YidC/Oxa1 family membrane protein insertase
VDLFEIISWLWHNGLLIPMVNFLVLISRVSFGNFGIAIIIFTLLMRAITWPITQQQLRATRAMQAVQPRIQEIQKQHKDPKRRSEETMKLYREAGVNPLGCLWPMLIQIPIWIALYQAIRVALGPTPEALLNLSQELYPWSFLRTAVPLENHFLWLDLGEPDPTFLMAILVGGSAWVQQRMLTPTTATMDPQQQQMNQTMMFMMPLLFAFWTLQFPSGLALYWLATNVVSIVLQYSYMGRRFDWRRIFTISPAPAPAATGSKRTEKAPEEPERESETAEVAADSTAKRRRRRRGGRRRR